MEINQISNSFDYSLQDPGLSVRNVGSIQNEKINDIGKIEDNIVNSEQNFSNSNISVMIKDDMEQLKNIQNLENVVEAQKVTVEKLEIVVKKNEVNINDAHKEVNQLLNNYNEGSVRFYPNLNDFVKEQKNDKSSMFFDGVLGSIPLSPMEIRKAIEEQKENLESITKSLNNKTAEVTQRFDKTIEKEKEVSFEMTKQIDFGKESKDFSNNNIQGIASAVISTQPNATLQTHSLKLLT